MSDTNKVEIRVYPYYNGNSEGMEYSEEVENWELNEDGVPYVNGYTNIQEYIQSFADECDINKIILSHLDEASKAELRDKGDSLVDTSVIPDSIHDIYAKSDFAQAFYNSLSADQKALFKNYDEFVEKYDILFKQNPIEQEVKSNE